MAFQQPQQRPQSSRPIQAEPIDTAVRPQQQQQRKRPIEESQEWILFSPQSQTDTTSQTPRTTNLSHVSDFGSLQTGLRSGQAAVADQEYGDDDELEDLDSLDDGLHAFQAPSSPRLDHSGGAILPRHDGLGTFPSSYEYADQEETQGHLWQFERYNPQRRRTQRRRSSVQRRLEAVDGEQDLADMNHQDERILRIEKWRMDQSKAVMEEIEKETKRRQRRLNRTSGTTTNRPESIGIKRSHDTAATLSASPPEVKAESESFWERITRKVIRDLIGLDDNTLSVIFGEEFVDTEDLPHTPTQTSPLASIQEESSLTTHPGNTWEKRLLDRIQRELGVLVTQLAESRGAFSTYAPLPPSSPDIFAAQRAAAHQTNPKTTTQPSASDVLFRPTLSQPPLDPSLFGIEEDTPLPPPSTLSIEQLVTYLRTRFSPAPAQTEEPLSTGPLPTSWATSSALGTSPSALRRAALIRAHHPLVSRASERRREALVTKRTALLGQALMQRSASSCASHSQGQRKRSKTGSNASVSSRGESRRYWDWAGGSTLSEGLGSEGVGWGEI